MNKKCDVKLGVIGLGYVGLTTAVCFASCGLNVFGCEIDPIKSRQIMKGDAPFVENRLPGLLKKAIKDNCFTIVSNVRDLLDKVSILMICVGTPTKNNGQQDLEHMRNVAHELGKAIADKGGEFIVVTRSTLLPSGHKEIRDILYEYVDEKSSVSYCVNPEFLREGQAIEDFFNATLNIIGANDRIAGETIAQLYKKFNCEAELCSIETASLIKYACNAFHALKICFANEIGRISKEAGCDGQEIMRLFCKDTKLNTSAAYLRPGFAYGGSCLPKDIASLLCYCNLNRIKVPLLGSVAGSNKFVLESVIEFIKENDFHKVLLYGITFKERTDDLRESPYVCLAEAIIGQGRICSIFDHEFLIERLHGTNSEYTFSRLPHLKKILIKQLDNVILDKKSLLIISKEPPNDQLVAIERIAANCTVLDLIGTSKTRLLKQKVSDYIGIAW